MRGLYKAKSKKTGEWVEGNLITNEQDETAYIGYIFSVVDGIVEDFDIVEVDPETLCQYTGMDDKNGKKIWENDIVYIRTPGLSGKGKVFYQNGCLCVRDLKRKRTYSLFGEWQIRVDGNIFDNPDLMGGE